MTVASRNGSTVVCNADDTEDGDHDAAGGDTDDNNCTKERSHMADGASLRLERRAALNCHPLHQCDHHCDPLGVIIIIVCLFV